MMDFAHFKLLQQEVLNRPEIKERAKPAAVVAIILEDETEPQRLIIIERNQNEGHHLQCPSFVLRICNLLLLV